MASDVRRKAASSVRPLLKRNTIADFANTKAYQESTASLISASDQGTYGSTLIPYYNLVSQL